MRQSNQGHPNKVRIPFNTLTMVKDRAEALSHVTCKAKGDICIFAWVGINTGYIIELNEKSAQKNQQQKNPEVLFYSAHGSFVYLLGNTKKGFG
jgi:hypothetical protein